MILPTKGIGPDKALLSVGAAILSELNEPKTVSRVWSDLQGERGEVQMSFDWFVLALDLLFAVGAVDYAAGRLRIPESSLEAQP